MITKTIHYCWFGSGKKSLLNLRCIASWQERLPSYAIKEWNESNAPTAVAYVQAAYQRKHWSRLSNYVRLHALYTEGGLYFDTDVEVLRTFDPLLDDTCFVGFQTKEREADWVNNAVMGSIRGHPFVQRCIEITLTGWAEREQFYRSPQVVTLALEELGLAHYGQQRLGDVTLYPVDYFYPFPWTQRSDPNRFGPQFVTPNTFCIHHWELSWIRSYRWYWTKGNLRRALRNIVMKLR